MKSIGIIGGGVIGLCSAYYLNKSGYRVTVIDQGSMTDGCSYGNAGMIVPSHIFPLAAPGMIAKGVRWMFNARSPFYVKPRLSGELIAWGYHFYKSATAEHVRRTIPALKEISLISKAAYVQMAEELPFDFGLAQRGLMMMYQTTETEREEIEAAHVANDNGIEAKILSPEQVQALEPDVRVTVKGGVLYPGDAHMTPRSFMEHLKEHLQANGVGMLPRTTVTDLIKEGANVRALKTNTGVIGFDEIIVATGAWSGRIGMMLGMSLPMQAGKGYSFTLPDVIKNINIPSILLEGRVAVTPMGSNLRFGGTMEITGVDHSISMNRVRGIVDTIPKYYPDLNVAMPDVKNIWHGLRPCSPDGLPYIGRLQKFKNVIIASGHAMMGLSLGAGSGKIIEEIVSEKALSMDLSMFAPERFSA